MAKQPQFYNHYIVAFFKRARADAFPYAFFKKEAAKVLKDDELTALDDVVDKLVALGALQKENETLRLVDKELIPLQAS